MTATLTDAHREILQQGGIWLSGTAWENVYLSVDGRGAVLDSTGEFLIPPDYSDEIAFGDGVVYCKTYRPRGSCAPRRSRLFDPATGEQTFELDPGDEDNHFTSVSLASGFAIVSYESKFDDHTCYVIDPRGNRLHLMGPDVTTCYQASIGGDFLSVDFGNSRELAIIDREANEVERIGPNFSRIELSTTSCEPAARVVVEGEQLWRVCTPRGHLSQNAYREIWRWSRAGHAIVRDGKLFGLIDTAGELVMPMSTMKLRSQSAGCVVFGDAKKGIMTVDGEVLVEPQYKEIILPTHVDEPQSFLAAKGKTWRLIDRHNKEVLRAKDFPAKPRGGGPTVHGNWHVDFEGGVGTCFVDGATFDITPVLPQF